MWSLASTLFHGEVRILFFLPLQLTTSSVDFFFCGETSTQRSLAEQEPCVVDRPAHLCMAWRIHACCIQVDAGVTSGYSFFILSYLWKGGEQASQITYPHTPHRFFPGSSLRFMFCSYVGRCYIPSFYSSAFLRLCSL